MVRWLLRSNWPNRKPLFSSSAATAWGSLQVSDCVEGVQRLFSNSLMMREKSNKGKMPARKCDMCRVIQVSRASAVPRCCAWTL
uniref:Secreted protein n=1 Tax=Knipowitschia caucasica TaxID=637954 RepID=A0AAV2L9G5_KNICA